MMAKRKYFVKAHDLFVYKGWSEEQIAALFNVSIATIKRWIKEGNWEAERVVVETSPWQVTFKLREEFYNYIKQKQLKQESIIDDSDKLVKTLSMILKLEDKGNILGEALIILRDVSEWLNNHYPILAKEFAKVFQPLTDYLWAKYSQ